MSFRNQLEQHLQIHAGRTGETIQRLRRKVAFDRFLARIATQHPSIFFLKGGYAMELRVAYPRATVDIDLTCFKRFAQNSEPSSEAISLELRALASMDLKDHFSFQIGMPQSDIENAPYGGARHSVSALIDNRKFVEFHLDVGGDFLVNNTVNVVGADWLGFCGIPAPTIPIISVEQQFAEKLHSYTLPRPHLNTRTKDLIDLVLLLQLPDQAPTTFYSVLQRVFRARNTHPLPDLLQEPPKIWAKPFAEMARECGVPQGLQECFELVSQFYYSVRELSKEPDAKTATAVIH